MFSKFPKAGHYTSATKENESPPVSPGRRLQAVLHNPWIVGGLAAVLGLPLLGYHLTYDHGIYAVLGDTLRRGGVAYRDAWEFRPPGIFWANFISFVLFGRSEFSVRLLDLIGVGASSAALFVLLRDRFAAPRAGIVAALSYPLIYVPCGHWITSQCEAFQAPLLLWSLALWPLADDRSPSLKRCYLSGFLSGAAVLFKTPTIFFPLLLLVDRLLLDRRLGKEGRQPPLWATAGGIVSLPAAMFLYYGLRGALPDLCYALFVYAPAYVQFSPPPTWALHLGGLSGVPALFSIPVCALSLLALIRVGARSRGEGLRLGALFTAAWLGIVIQGRYYDQHLMALAAWLALGAGLAVPAGGGRRPYALLAWGALLGALLLRGSESTRRWLDPAAPDQAHAECERPFFSYGKSLTLARAIQARCAPDERIFLWANDPLAAFLCDRPLAGPYSHIGMIFPYWEGPERVEALVKRLRREPPRLIVLGEQGPLFQAESASQILNELPSLKAFIHGQYRLEGRSGDYQFWVR